MLPITIMTLFWLRLSWINLVNLLLLKGMKGVLPLCLRLYMTLLRLVNDWLILLASCIYCP